MRRTLPLDTAGATFLNRRTWHRPIGARWAKSTETAGRQLQRSCNEAATFYTYHRSSVLRHSLLSSKYRIARFAALSPASGLFLAGNATRCGESRSRQVVFENLLKALVKEALDPILQGEMTDFLGASPNERNVARENL